MSWLLLMLLAGGVHSSRECTIVEFTKDQCGPCQQLQPALEQLRREGWTIRTVNTDREPLLVRRYAIESLPTIVVLSEDREIDRIVGAAPYEKIAARLAKHTSSERDAAHPTNNPLSPHINSPSSPANTPAFSQSANQFSGENRFSETQQAVAPASGLTVRGQSPGLSAFPMLASAASATAIAADRLHSEVTQFANDLQAPAVQPATFEQSPVQIPESTLSPRNTTVPLTIQQAITRAEAATVRIRVDEENTTAYGTGTIIDVHDDEALVLTCGHLFREMKPHSQLTIDLYAGGRSQPVNLPAQLIDFRADPGAEDVGLISFKLPFPVEPVELLPKSDALALGQAAFSFGCDHGENPTRRDTQVKSINRYMGAPNVEIAGAPAVGRSGGGLFDNQGRLIGVCNAADAAGDEGIFAAAEIVYKQIDRLGLTHLFDKSQGVAKLRNSAPVQPVSATNLAHAGANSFTANSTASASQIQWPDQSANAAQWKSQQPAAQSLAGVNLPPASNGSASQMICILRDANGRDQVVTVDAPPAELIDAIHRQARR